MPHATTSKGDIGVAYATADLIEKGWEVLIPVNATSPFDLVAHKDGKFRRVQVKYRSPVNGRLDAVLRRHVIKRGKIARMIPNLEVDVLCIFNPENRKCYYVLTTEKWVCLRVTTARNGQRQRIRDANDFLDFPA